MYRALIAAHAVTATTAVLAVFGGRRRHWFAVYYGSMVAMLVTLVAAIAVDASGRPPGGLALSGALVALGGVMVWHADLARRHRADTGAFVDHTGFTVVGLVDAFVVVTALDAGLSGWLAAAIAAVIARCGHLAIRHTRDRATKTVGSDALPAGV